MDLHFKQPLPRGTAVEVFSPFSSSWVNGFEVVTDFDDGYELRRRSDQAILPTTFHVEDVRLEHQ